MAKSSQSSSRSILSSKRDDSQGLSRKELEELKNELNKKNKKSFIPEYFEMLLYRCEVLMKNGHTDSYNYTIPNVFKLSDIQESIRRNDIVERHLLDTSFEVIIHSKDKNDQSKKVKYYNNLIKRYTKNGE